MIFRKKSISLSRLAAEDIEMVRNWRNAPHVRSTMNYKGEITSEMQLTWFNSINNNDHCYFVVNINDTPVGLINVAEINWSTMTSNNVGIFIGEQQYLGSMDIVRATILFTELFFYAGLKIVYGKVLADNLRAIDYNLRFGYQLLPGQENEHLQVYALTADSYLSATKRIRAFLSKEREVELLVTRDEYEQPSTFLSLLLDPALPRISDLSIDLALSVY